MFRSLTFDLPFPHPVFSLRGRRNTSPSGQSFAVPPHRCRPPRAAVTSNLFFPFFGRPADAVEESGCDRRLTDINPLSLGRIY